MLCVVLEQLFKICTFNKRISGILSNLQIMNHIIQNSVYKSIATQNSKH